MSVLFLKTKKKLVYVQTKSVCGYQNFDNIFYFTFEIVCPLSTTSLYCVTIKSYWWNHTNFYNYMHHATLRKPKCVYETNNRGQKYTEYFLVDLMWTQYSELRTESWNSTATGIHNDYQYKMLNLNRNTTDSYPQLNRDWKEFPMNEIKDLP